MKKILVAIIIGIVLITGAGFLFSKDMIGSSNSESKVLQQTYDVSKEYLLLRYRTDNILVNAKQYSDYLTWDGDMTVLLKDWESLEKKSQELEESAGKTSQAAAANFSIVKTAHAYSAKEISNIYDKAPKFKGISRLANHLGVDAKRAQAILNQAQAEITAGVFIEEGDAFENLENTAIVVKDGCKVAGFVGTVVLTGGAAGGFAAGTLTQVGTVIVGTDLALEVTEDSAQIAFGDRNKVSSLVKDVRTVTEPIASIITITSIPGNLGSAYGKFDSVMVGLEQFRDTVQEGKVVGVDLTNFEYKKPFQRIRQAKYPGTVTVAEMEKAEVEEWLKSLNKEYKPMTQEEVEDFLKSPPKQTEKEEIVEENSEAETSEGLSKVEETDDSIVTNNTEITNTSNGKDAIVGEWQGTMRFTPSASSQEQQKDYNFTLNNDGSISGTASGAFDSWKKEGNSIKLFIKSEVGEGYDEYVLSGDTLTFVKRAGLNSEGEWQEDYAGSDFFGGKFMQVSLKRKLF